jgi:hypothetical protein
MSIKLNISEKRQPTDFIIGSNDPGALGCLDWAMERHNDAISYQLKSIFQKILNDTKTRKDRKNRFFIICCMTTARENSNKPYG